MFKGNVQQKPSSNLLPMLMLGTLFSSSDWYPG